ncbi:hypothetical protein ABFX02_10G106100 [Erythranthe guttata]
MKIDEYKKSKLLSTKEITSIHQCAEAGNLIALQTLLLQNPSLLNQTSAAFMVQTPLHIAASVNKIEIMKYLLNWEGPGKVELEAKNVYGETPLHTAAKNGCNEAVKLLLDSGVNIEARTNNSMTPLHLAVGYALRSGDNSTVKTLSEYNADCSAKDHEGMIPFNYLPIGLQNEELVKILKIIVPDQTDDSAKLTYNPMVQSRAGNHINKIMGMIHSPGNSRPGNYEEKLNKIIGIIQTSGSSMPENYKQYIKKFTEIINTSSGNAPGNNYEDYIKQFMEMNNTSGSSSGPGNNDEDYLKQFMEMNNTTGSSSGPGNNYEGYIQHLMETMTNTTGNSGLENYGELINNITGQSNTPGYPFTGHPNGIQKTEDPKNDEIGIEKKMEEFHQELAKIVGLYELKLQLKKWAKGMLMDEKRRAAGINLGPRKAPHMAFLGNPGTGKTSVARILGKLLKSVGVLSSDKVIEVQRTDLVGEYTGQTGPKTRKKIEEAMGGTLFVDEAYRLVPEKNDSQDFGVEALEEIMSVLEDGNIVVIFAGYTEPMKRVFSSNQGFCRRVTHFFQFDDFTCKDLAEMLMIKMTKQNEKSALYGFKLHPSCTHDIVLKVIENNSTEKLRNKMNGGLVDHMLNNARENLDSRLNFNSKGDELFTITSSDLEAGLKMLSQQANVD